MLLDKQFGETCSLVSQGWHQSTVTQSHPASLTCSQMAPNEGCQSCLELAGQGREFCGLWGPVTEWQPDGNFRPMTGDLGHTGCLPPAPLPSSDSSSLLSPGRTSQPCRNVLPPHGKILHVSPSFPDQEPGMIRKRERG